MGIELLGAEELIRELKRFGPDVTELATETGIKKAGAQVRKDLRRAAPRSDAPTRGLLKSSIGMKYSKRGRTAWIGLRASRRDAKKGNKRGTAARLYYKVLEFGRKPYKRTYKRGGGGSVKGNPPMRPFFQKTFGRNVTKYANLVVQETEKAVYASAVKVRARQSRALIRKGGKL